MRMPPTPKGGSVKTGIPPCPRFTVPWFPRGTGAGCMRVRARGNGIPAPHPAIPCRIPFLESTVAKWAMDARKSQKSLLILDHLGILCPGSCAPGGSRPGCFPPRGEAEREPLGQRIHPGGNPWRYLPPVCGGRGEFLLNPAPRGGRIARRGGGRTAGTTKPRVAGTPARAP